MGSASDLPLAKDALRVLASFGVPYTARVLSAHRTPEQAAAFARSAEAEGFGVILAFAGKAAHLAGAMAANSLLPVVGVPVSGRDLGGLDALLSTAQMPKGVPVATFAIGAAGAANAALFAVAMLANRDDTLRARLEDFRKRQTEAARAMTLPAHD